MACVHEMLGKVSVQLSKPRCLTRSYETFLQYIFYQEVLAMNMNKSKIRFPLYISIIHANKTYIQLTRRASTHAWISCSVFVEWLGSALEGKCHPSGPCFKVFWVPHKLRLVTNEFPNRIMTFCNLQFLSRALNSSIVRTVILATPS
jgi:hypothetical protein